MKAQVKKSGRTTHGNKQAKEALVEAGWAASRTKNTFVSAKYHKTAARRGKKKAVVATAHWIAKVYYSVVKNECEYRELGADHINKRHEQQRKKYLTKELEKIGYSVTLNCKEQLIS